MRCNSNPEKVTWISPTPFKKGGTPWNKGLTKETSPIIAANAEKSRNALSGRPGKPHSDETKKRLREVALERGLGGYQEKSGRGKAGRYKSIWCDSSWELAFLLWCLDHGCNIERANVVRQYKFKGKLKNYHPDFKVDGSLVEIKGYTSEEWEAKKCFNPDVIVYGKEEIQPILKWVKLKYGSNFLSLYDEKSDRVKNKPIRQVSNQEVKARELAKLKEREADKAERQNQTKQRKELQVKERLEKLSYVDFLKFGWVQKVANILGISHTSARRFVNRYYSGEVFTRKSPK